ncbi:Hydantoinase B/oxoprolinase-domain-containing protein [Xylaria bambusicola]|uniref:Hydantoinase B/oxoprolinase-domain-containing protein n=1 Tax=Xylaria bambusicola TaxID=326684 RepID=UPI002008D708|nr:Hydantoinase B/oxoprolinase-domain-containing protein [Xylaria bambusicola]KAI0506439.1 Hydantoinase B/oxoprolinase-domain-containing protein [Xylaria bambusicola]
MGGTSTDVSRFSGTYDHVFETVTAVSQQEAALCSFGEMGYLSLALSRRVLIQAQPATEKEIAEQMGRTPQKTSVSTNVKERLDFSGAMFSPDGGLVANAPHVPVHLGSMQFCVKHMHELWKCKLEEGGVLVSNHPSQGGTHLPDITVVTPIFSQGEIIFYVASRGHHAEKLVEKGRFGRVRNSNLKR